jgi:hypothetical protein
VAVELLALAIDSSSPRELRGSGHGALRWDVGEGTSGKVESAPTDPIRFRLVSRSGAQDKVGQNPIHFDP